MSPLVTGLVRLPGWLGYRAQQTIVTDCVFSSENHGEFLHMAMTGQIFIC